MAYRFYFPDTVPNQGNALAVDVAEASRIGHIC